MKKEVGIEYTSLASDKIFLFLVSFFVPSFRDVVICIVIGAAALLVVAVWPNPIEENQHRQLTPARLDFKTVETKKFALIQYHEISHEEDRICIAIVDDATVLSATVVHESGHLDVALPEGHETSAAVPCTSYAHPPSGLASAEYTTALVYKPLRHCDPKSFRPGYYNKQLLTWNDACTGKVTNTAVRSQYARKALLSADTCPIRSQEKDLWVSFVGEYLFTHYTTTRIAMFLVVSFARLGDSVHRLFFQNLWRRAGNHMRYTTHMKWMRGRNAEHPDFLLYRIGRFGRRIWLSFTYSFMRPDSLSDAWQLPYTWGDFVLERKQGRRRRHPSDPKWPLKRVPDVVFYSPGYHASKLDASTYGMGLEGILRKWQEAIHGHGATMPAMHLMLNMMPAPWLIPQRHAWDRDYRTLLNEYRKNLAIIAAAKKFDFVQSVVDVFSIELPFNGDPGHSAHMDAVHINDKRVLRIAGDRILDTLCSTL